MSNLQHNSMLRKTQSQPASKTNTLPPMSSIKNMKKSAQKHSRCKSVPGPADDAVNPKKKPSADDANNKADKKAESRKTSVNSSPKPKRTIFEGFRNTLRPKSKSHEATSSSGMASKISAAVISTTSACGASAQGSNCLPLVAGSGEPVVAATATTTSPLHKGYASVAHSTPDLGRASSEQCFGSTAERKAWRQSSTGQEDSPSPVSVPDAVPPD